MCRPLQNDVAAFVIDCIIAYVLTVIANTARMEETFIWRNVKVAQGGTISTSNVLI